MFNPYLPQETLDYIVDLLHDERETLKECCLVSKSWIPRARKHLFAGIKFGSVDNLESWKKTFPNPPDSPAYHTLTLTIGCTQAVTTEDAEPGGWIPTFSRVVRLELSISRIDPINPSGMEAILAPYHKFSPALKSLRIESKFLSYPPIFNLVRSFSFLEDLALIGCHPWWEGNDSNLHQQQNVDPSASGPAFIGSLELLLGGLRNVARRLLDLPNGFHFRKLVLLWIGVEDLWWIMKLVERCSDTLECIDVMRYQLGDSSPTSIDLSKATKLRDVAFRPEPPTVTWIITTLQTIASKHRDLQQILIYLPSYFASIDIGASIGEINGEVIYREWLDLDRLLIQLWESRSVRPKLTLAAPMGDREQVNIQYCIECLLPELTRRGVIVLAQLDW